MGTTNPLEPEDLTEGIFRLRLDRIVYSIILNIIIAAGILGNTLAFIILTRKSIRSTTTSVYLRLLALADILVLVTAIFRYKTYKILLRSCMDVSVFFFDPYVEVYIEPFHWISLGMSSFITLALSVERYVAVKYPLAIKHTSKLTVVRVCTAVVLFTAIYLTLPNFFTYSVSWVQFENTTVAIAQLTPFGNSSQYMCLYHEYIIPICWYLLPCYILTSLNFLLCIKVQRSSRMRLGLPKANRNRKLTILVISVIAVYILCNLPRCILVFYRLVHFPHFCKETRNFFSPTPRSYLNADVSSNVLNVLNSCLNIIIYCIVGTKFRQELCHIVTCQKLRFRRKVFPALPTVDQKVTSLELLNYRQCTQPYTEK